jgi:rieske iron-sulfur protein
MRLHRPPDSAGCERRTVLGAGLTLVPLLARAAHAQDSAAHAQDSTAITPQTGDCFVFLAGPKKGQVVKVADLPLGGPQIQVYPADPKSGVVRDGSRLNLVILIRFDPADLSQEVLARAANGVVAYTGVCTHQACPVNMWSKDRCAVVCSCHGSVFDPKNGAQVLDGPAPRPLPALSLRVEDGGPVVASSFSGRVGGMKS